jgi:hypothetical protein
MTDGKEERATRFAGIGGHHSHNSGTNDWITPRWVFERLGPFDLDPCASLTQPWPTARRSFTVADNGLLQRWDGRVWLNPPYSNGEVENWMARMADYGRGTALIFARTETAAFHSFVWRRTTALLFPRGRLTFHRPDGSLPEAENGGGNAGAPSVFCAYGAEDAERLSASGIDGAFIRCERRAILDDARQFEMEWAS